MLKYFLCSTILSSLFILAPLSAKQPPKKVIKSKHYDPPLKNLKYGEMKMVVDEKFLFDPEHIIYSTLLIYSPENRGVGRQFMMCGEAINHVGTSVEIFDGKKMQVIESSDSSITERESDWTKVKAFDNNYFTKWLRQPKDKKGITTNKLLRDTMIDGIQLQYVKITDDSSEVRIGNQLQKNPDGSIQMSLVERFYYVEPEQQSLKRFEEYVYMSNDTEITKTNLLYAKPLESAAALQQIFSDTLNKYSAIYKFKTVDTAKHPKGLDSKSFVGQPFPIFELSGLDGNKTTIKDLPAKYLLLDCSYNSCFPCHLSIPMLKQIEKEFSAKGLEVIGIDPVDHLKEIEYNIEKNSITYPVYSVNKEELTKLGIDGFPTFLLLNSNRIVRYYYSGYRKGMYDTLSKDINEMMTK